MAMESDGTIRDEDLAFGLPRENAFSRDEHVARLRGVRELVQNAGLDALIVQHPSNVYYLSGFSSKVMFYFESLILPAEGPPTLAVLEWEMAVARLTSIIDRIEPFPVLDAGPNVVAALVTEAGLGRARIGLEMRSPNLSGYRLDALRESLPLATLVDGSGLVEAQKVIKSPAELECVRAAATLSDRGIKAAVSSCRAGTTDSQVAGAIYETIISGGSDYMTMDPVVVTGRRSGIMHASHHGVVINRNDSIAIELGAVVRRYSAPLQRTITVGKVSRDLRRLEEASTTAIENMLSIIRPGASARDVARAAQDGVDIAGSDVYYHKGCAYSVGAAFPPNWVEGSYYIGGNNPLALDDVGPLRAGMVLNLPMSLRYVGVTGIMQNETVVVTDDGCVPLSTMPRRLLRAGEPL